jgi:hypothetical protein
MSYVKSAAISGKGSALSIGTTGGTPTFTLLGECTSVDFSGNTAGTADVTNFQSGSYKEFIATIIDSGTVKLAGNRVSSDAGQVAVTTAFASLQVVPWKLDLPLASGQTVTGDSVAFNALVESNEFSVSTEKQIAFSITLKVSGPMTTTPGT